MLVCLTGLPRFSEIYDRGLSALTRAGARVIVGHFWDYGSELAPQTNMSMSGLPQSEADWQAVHSAGFKWVTTSPPLAPVDLPFDPARHSQISSLSLKPNYDATKSWLTAVSRAVQELKVLDPNGGENLWMVGRPDIVFSASALRRLVKLLAKDAQFSQHSVAVAARPRAHRVLQILGARHNLPIDHFFIGKPEAITKLSYLVDSLELIESGADSRQPIVNEFVLGQFFADHDLIEYPVRLPYILWRGGYVRSLIGFGAQGLSSRANSLRNNLTWLLYSYMRPGFHRQGT